MSVGPVGGLPAIPSLPSVGAASPTAGAGKVGGAGFGDVASLIDSLQQQDKADQLSVQAAAGHGNVGDVMIAAQEASLSTNLTVAVRNKAVDAFNQIMGMQF